MVEPMLPESVSEEYKKVDEEIVGDTVTLSTGIVLRGKRIPPLIFRDIGKDLKYPNPPKVFLQEKQREEENPNDPYYQQRCAEIDNERNAMYENIILMRGLEVVSVPPGTPSVDDDEWVEQVEAVIDVDLSNRYKRMASWLKYVAIATPKDLLSVIVISKRKNSILEDDVVEEENSKFRDAEKGGAS